MWLGAVYALSPHKSAEIHTKIVQGFGVVDDVVVIFACGLLLKIKIIFFNTYMYRM